MRRQVLGGGLIISALLPALATTGLANPALAQQAVCESDKTDDMQRCASVQLKASEQKLNAAYQQLLAVLRKKGMTDVLKSLQAAEQLWVRSREADCTLYKTAYSGGSLAQLGYTNCLAARGAQRTQQLQTYMEEFSR